MAPKCMWPVSSGLGVSQHFAELPTGKLPADHWIIKQFGNYQPNGHAGIDIPAPIGTKIVAPYDAVVTWADWGHNLPGDESHAGYVSRYYLYKNFPGIVTVLEARAINTAFIIAHQSDNNFVKPGQTVKMGQLIGLSGNTGGSTGPHVHIEVLPMTYDWGNSFYGRVDPIPYFQIPFQVGGQTVSTASKPVAKPATPTPVKETTVALTAAEIKAIAKAVVNEPVKTEGLGKEHSATTNLGVRAAWGHDEIEKLGSRVEGAIRSGNEQVLAGQRALDGKLDTILKYLGQHDAVLGRIVATTGAALPAEGEVQA